MPYAALMLLGGLAAAGLGMVALLRGQVRWARMNRRTGGLVVASGLVAAMVGGGMSARDTSTIAAGTTSDAGSGASAFAPSTGTTTGPGDVPTSSASATTKGVAGQPIPQAKVGTALAALATLAVKGRAPRTGYDRALFGQAWADVDRNGCDTRNDVLRRDLAAYVLKAGTHGCLVTSGTLNDPYTGTSIAFLRGSSTSSRVQIDHVVALSDAWQKGAQQMSPESRRALANDSINLLAVDGPSNQRKSDGDAATWLPPNNAYRCSYAARQVAVKVKFRLWVTLAEGDALGRILSTCPTQALPSATAFVLGGGEGQLGGAAPTPVNPVAPQPIMPLASSGDDPRFDTCKAATAAGYGPYHRGRDVEYDWYRDGDGDGIGCE